MSLLKTWCMYVIYVVLCSCLCSIRQQPAISRDVFRLCINTTASPADQQLNVRWTRLIQCASLNRSWTIHTFTCFLQMCGDEFCSVLKGTSRGPNVTSQSKFSCGFASRRRAVLKKTIFHPICVWKSTGSHVTCRWGALHLRAFFFPAAHSWRVTGFSFDEYLNFKTSLCSQQKGKFSLFPSNILVCHPGLSSSNQKRRRAQAAQSAHQHYLTGQIVHHSPQYHRGVVDCWDWKGKGQSDLIKSFIK